MPERVAIVGSRKWSHAARVGEYVRALPAGTIVISGGAAGVDTVAIGWARRRGLAVEVIVPDYDRHPGHLAPLIRNGEIAARCDRLVAFHDGESRGTLDVIAKARKLGKPVEVILPDSRPAESAP